MTRYLALTQSPYCCVPTCLLMILIRRGLPTMQIDEIGAALGLTVPEEIKALYPNAIIGPKPLAGYGTQIQLEEFSINSFFTKHKIPLVENYINLPLEQNNAWLKNLLLADADLMVCFNHRELFGGNSDWGHVCLIDSIESDAIYLIDPEYRQPKVRKVSYAALIQAVIVHGAANRSGFWMVRKN